MIAIVVCSCINIIIVALDCLVTLGFCEKASSIGISCYFPCSASSILSPTSVIRAGCILIDPGAAVVAELFALLVLTMRPIIMTLVISN